MHSHNSPSFGRINSYLFPDLEDMWFKYKKEHASRQYVAMVLRSVWSAGTKDDWFWNEHASRSDFRPSDVGHRNGHQEVWLFLPNTKEETFVCVNKRIVGHHVVCNVLLFMFPIHVWIVFIVLLHNSNFIVTFRECHCNDGCVVTFCLIS